jgi:hypothetical protein
MVIRLNVTTVKTLARVIPHTYAEMNMHPFRLALARMAQKMRKEGVKGEFGLEIENRDKNAKPFIPATRLRFRRGKKR